MAKVAGEPKEPEVEEKARSLFECAWVEMPKTGEPGEDGVNPQKGGTASSSEPIRLNGRGSFSGGRRGSK